MVGLTLASLLASALLGADGGDGGKDYLDYMRITYRANRGVIEYGRFSGEYRQGNATSAEAARAGQMTNLLKASCVYAFDGKNIRNDRVFPERDVLASSRRIGRPASVWRS